MTRRRLRLRLALGVVGCVAGGAVGPTGAAAATQDVRWVCEVAYQPARSTWTREVVVQHDQRRVRSVQIDGVPVYAFTVQDTTILTALDNERVRFDTRAQTWQSDFRGLASGQGRCERLP